MHVIVCFKQVIDPEAPPASFKVDTEKGTVSLPPNVSPVIDPYAEYAVEAALRIKDATGAKVTALSMGTSLLRDVVKKPLAMGADDLVLLEDEAFNGGDSWSTACALAAAIKKLPAYDLILCGREASDWDAGQVGLGIAELLSLPSVTVTRKLEVSNGRITVERVTENGSEVVEAALPAVVTVSSELGEPRYPTIKGIMAAKKKEPVIWKPTDIGLGPEKLGKAGRLINLVKLFQPVHEAKCEVVAADTPEEAGTKLAQRLRETKVL